MKNTANTLETARNIGTKIESAMKEQRMSAYSLAIGLQTDPIYVNRLIANGDASLSFFVEVCNYLGLNPEPC
jgi:hypothetical protein